jgi:glycosyltransferase involved in cell wall biosynthesis
LGLKYTIIIPVRIVGGEIENKVSYLNGCYQSCLNQTADNVEIILADNQSDPEAFLSFKPYESAHPQTKVVKSEYKYPYSWYEPVHAAWEVMTGDYFTIIAYDDFIDPDYIENINKIMSKTNIQALQSPVRSIDKNGKKKNEPDISHSYKNLDEFKQQYMTRCPVNTPSVVYRADLVYDGKLESDPGMYFGYDDYFLYGSMAEQGIFIAPFPKWLGYYYRWHPEQATNGMKRDYPDLEQKIQEYWRNRWTE